MRVPLIDLKRQFSSIREEIESKILQILNSGQYIMGENVKGFEKEICDYLEIKHCIGVANGTDALVIALKALGIGEGDEVITTPFTFFASAESISLVGATPVFVDVEVNTYNMDPNKIEEAITSKTKAIMPVHIFGQPCEMDTINEIARKHNLKVIEDAAQAIGAEYKGRMAGSLADIACFSFFPTKNLGCAGDGGMIVTNNDDLAIKCRAYANHGSGEIGYEAYKLIHNDKEEFKNSEEDTENTIYNPLKYYNYLIGQNSRLDELQAAILRIKLKRLDEWNEARKDNAYFYEEELKSTALITPYASNNVKHVYHLYVVHADYRDELVNYLNEKNIATGIYYPIPLHLQKAYKDLKYQTGSLPNAEYLSTRTFAIPIFAELTKEEKYYIVETIRAFDKEVVKRRFKE